VGFPVRKNIALPPFTKNNVHLLVNGNEILDGILELIEDSTRYLCIQVMLIHPDQAGFMIVEALKKASRRGVKIYLSFDLKQSTIGPIYLPYSGDEANQRQSRMNEMLNDLKESGVKIINNRSRIPFFPGELSSSAEEVHRQLLRNTCISMNHIDHRKIFLADGKKAIIGGTNIGNEYLYNDPPDLDQNMVEEAVLSKEVHADEPWEKWLDAAVIVEGPAAESLSEEFFNRWEILGGEPVITGSQNKITGTKPVQVLSQRPGNQEIALAYLELIRNAQQSIYISSPYVSYRPGLEELMAACIRGVDVSFVFPGELNDVPVSRRIFRSLTDELLSAGIKIYESNQRMIHSKVMTVDRRWTIIGSFNFDYRSFVHDFEQNILIDDTNFADETINRIFNQYLAISTQLTEPYPTGLNIFDRLIFLFS
jgi:cardiolipin synthase